MTRVPTWQIVHHSALYPGARSIPADKLYVLSICHFRVACNLQMEETMNIKRLLLSALFTLVSGLMTSLATKSKAEVTSWDAGYPIVRGGQQSAGGHSYYWSYDILLKCEVLAEGPNILSWTDTSYIIVGPSGATGGFGGGGLCNPNTPNHGGKEFPDYNVVPGSYDCLAIASGIDTVTKSSWSGSTGDTWITVP